MNPTENNRKFQLPMSELVDRLTIAQIKVALSPQKRADFNNEIELLSHDIDLIIQNSSICLDAKLIGAIVQLGQINHTSGITKRPNAG